MQQITITMTAVYVWLTLPRDRDERGDIPGWVLVTVMTAGIVGVIWGVAGRKLEDLLMVALNKITP